MNNNFPNNLPKGYGPFGGREPDAKANVLNCVVEETRRQISKAADEQIEKQVETFRRSLLEQKETAISAVMKSIRVVVSESPATPYELNIRIEYQEKPRGRS